MRGTFVMFETRRLPAVGVHETERVPTTPAAASADDLLFTRLELTRKAAAEGFNYAQIIHRRVMQPQRYGDARFFHGGKRLRELVVEQAVPAYYDPARALLVCYADRDLAWSALRALNRGIDGFTAASVRIDPQRVRDAHARGVLRAVWLRRPGDPGIRTQAAFGSNVRSFSKIGDKNTELSSISLQTTFASRRLRVNVSRGGSVFFAEDTPLATCLSFLVDVLNHRANRAPATAKKPARPARKRR